MWGSRFPRAQGLRSEAGQGGVREAALKSVVFTRLEAKFPGYFRNALIANAL